MKMKQLRRAAAGMVSVILLSTLLPAFQVTAHGMATDENYIDIIIRYEETVPDEDTLDPRYKNINTMDLLPVQTMTVPASAVKDISLQEDVRRIAYNQEVVTSESTYTVSDEDWNQEMIGTFDAWDEGYTGQGVDIAVLDTGFYQHPEITYAGGHSIFGEDDESGPDEWTNDHSGHGTHISGILGAQTGTRAQGIAPDADLYGVKVYHEANGDKTRVGNLLQGLNWAIQNESDIIVISSGYANLNQEIHDMLQIAYDQGALIFAASGNMTGDNTSIDYPAAHEEVIAVTGINQRQARVTDAMVANENELAAPGQNILGLSIDGTHTTMSGTSQATPHAAGIAALLMEKYPDESSAAIRQRLTDQALDLGDPGHDVLYGHGLVQFSAQPSQQPAPDEEPETEPDQEDDTQDETTENDTENTEDTDDSAEETDENTENDITEEPDSEPEENTENISDITEESEPNEEISDEEPAEDEESESDADRTDEEEEPESGEQQNQLDQRSTVWVRPSETNGLATVADEDIEAVAENGVLAVSFDASLGSIDRISLTEAQAAALKEKDITLLVARADLEWLIPSENLSEGDAFITFKSARSNYAHEDLTKGKILSFGIEQNGKRLEDFPSDMIYRFFTPQAEYNGDHLYEWNESTESWELLGDKYTKGGVVGVTAETGTLAVFDPEELESAVAAETNEPEEENEDTTEESESEQPETAAGNDENYFAERSQGLPVVLSSVVVVLLSVTGGFYFFGGKSGS